MIMATKEITFDCAHMLVGHQGLCRNLHGHTYKLQVELSRYDGDCIIHGPAAGMVIDFKDIKEIMQQVAGQFDHAFIFNVKTTCPTELAIKKALEEGGMRIVPFDGRATAERMSEYFCKELNARLKGCTFRVTEVRLWETPTSYATYREER